MIKLFKLSSSSSIEKYWIQETSLNSAINDNLNHVKSASKQNFIDPIKRETSSLKKDMNKKLQYNDDDENDENDESDEDDYNFLKDKRVSDQNYLNKLNQINLNSELKIENTDFNLFKNRRNLSSRNHEGSFLHSTSQNSINNERPNSSKLSNYSRSQVRTTPIPPAEKNMEVIVGKGRRSANNSARQNTPKTSLPPSGRISKTNSTNKINLVCLNCKKAYENEKDMEIHKMYCM